MTVTVRPPTQPPAEPLITVELSYIINVSEGLDGDPSYLLTQALRLISGRWSVLDGGRGLYESCCGGLDDAPGTVRCSPETAHISLFSRAPPIPTVPAGTTPERELGQP